MSDLEQAQEDANWQACRAAYLAAWPARLSSSWETCEGMEWDCPGCPFKHPGTDPA